LNLPIYIAGRYLFSKKSHNAINVISLVSVCGVAVATLSMVFILSVFNGFHQLFAEMFSTFDPELKITAVKGKVFNSENEKFLEIQSWPEIEQIAETLEDNVLIRYRNRQTPATLKGVSSNFSRVIPIDQALFDGKFQLQDETSARANLGIGVASALGVAANFVFPLEIHTPRRNAKTINLANPLSAFNNNYAYISSIFRIDQSLYDDNYLIVSLELARTLFEYSPSEVGAWELKLKNPADLPALQKKIQNLLGKEYAVKNRYQQQEAAFKMINIEKWITFLMLSCILLITAFNIIGSLSMLMVDKQNDIQTLRKLGASNQLISSIFLFEGGLISVLGAAVGVLIGLLLSFGQQYFGWIKLGSAGAFAVEAYPVQVQAGDILLILITVCCLGFLSVIYPVRYLSDNQLKTKN
jgi:lipoprotein-releasing system permease protein/zinc transport system substrate-binding protein